MVYVFGIQGVPLFEMLFVFMLLMLAGLVLILIELRKLNKYLTLEKTDISRFESDLQKLEKGESPQQDIGRTFSESEIKKFVEKSRSEGQSDEDIKKRLMNAGWSEQDLQKYFN